MSKYTSEIKYICEKFSGYSESALHEVSIDDVINRARVKIFDFNYPIYDPEYKPTLENKILKHYYTREICAETYNLWKTWLNAKMNDIMPKYNKLYQMEHDIAGKELKNIDVDINQLRTDDLLRQSNFTRTDNLKQDIDSLRTDNLHEETSNTNTHSDTNKRRFSDTPQGSIAFADADTGNVWLTEYERNDNNGDASDTGERDNTGTQRTETETLNTGTQKNDGTDKNTGTQKNESSEVGYRGSKTYIEILSDYADNVVNIDRMIINELSDLFFGLW